jgi:putative flippase GtrA
MGPLLLARSRVLRFALVGAVCFAAQFTVLRLLTAVGVAQPLGNAIGFLLSAQLNYALSSGFTWGDRRGAVQRAALARLLSFNGATLIGLAINTAVFTLCYRSLGALPASALGVLVGSASNFLICDLMVIRRRAGRHRRRSARVNPPLTTAAKPRPAMAEERP